MNHNAMKNLLPARKIWKEQRLYWVSSYKTILKYISKDYVHILKPIVKKPLPSSKSSGTRYFVSEENLQKFIEMFENNQLS